MKTRNAAAAITILAASFALAATPAMTMSHQTGEESGEMSGAGHGQSAMKDNVKGYHPMSGTVSAIDHQTGKVTVETGVGPLNLHFPPPAIADVAEGQTVTVYQGFTLE